MSALAQSNLTLSFNQIRRYRYELFCEASQVAVPVCPTALETALNSTSDLLRAGNNNRKNAVMDSQLTPLWTQEQAIAFENASRMHHAPSRHLYRVDRRGAAACDPG